MSAVSATANTRAHEEALDIPYYPIRLNEEQTLLGEYLERACSESDVSFIGRLGTYRYLDMDVTIREAMDAADSYLQGLRDGASMHLSRVAA